MYYLKAYLISLIIPIILHGIFYITDSVVKYIDDNDTITMVLITTFLWPFFVAILSVCAILAGTTMFIPWLKKSYKERKKNKIDRIKIASEVVYEEKEVLASTRHQQ